MRCTQFIGLNYWASDLLRRNEEPLYTKRVTHILPNGAEEQQPDEEVRAVPKIPVGKWYGMCDDDGSVLYQYTLLNGTKVTEYVQAEPWSSGPCIFLALKDENGDPIADSLWDDDEIENC